MPYGDYSSRTKAKVSRRNSKLMVIEDIEKSNVIDSIKEVSVYSTKNSDDGKVLNPLSDRDVITPKNVLKRPVMVVNNSTVRPYSKGGSRKTSGDKNRLENTYV